jgi:hypothetical protein
MPIRSPLALRALNQEDVEAPTQLLGGEEKVVQAVSLWRDGVPLGNQRMRLLEPDVAFHLTGLAEGIENYEPHLRSMLRYSRLRAIQWINMARHQVQLATLVR